MARKELLKVHRNAIASIIELVEPLKSDDDDVREKACQAIHEDALDLQVRDGWRQLGDRDQKPAEFCLLLATGGPAVRLVGTIDEYGLPETAVLEVQDWGTPWTAFKHTVSKSAQEALLAYARCFCFEEGY